MTRFAALAAILVLALSGCSSRGMYESIQSSGERVCGTLPPEAYERCMARYEKSYDEYERERESL